MKINTLILSFLLLPVLVFGEIEQIIVKWQGNSCFDSCVKGLSQQFLKITQVSDYKINMSANQAELRWKPNIPFTFIPIANAMSMIGLGFDDFRMRVRGTLSHDTKNVTLVSLGDNTPFILLGPIIPNRNRYVLDTNPETHVITPELRKELLNAEQQNQIAIIEGPLFEPERSPPFRLIAERVRFIKKPSEK